MKNVFFKFPFVFDTQRLLADLAICQVCPWTLHFNQNDYTGTWSSFSLRSISGKETDALSNPYATYQDTPSLAKCLYFKEITESFLCEKEAIRLLSLSPKSYIKEHTDANAGYESGFLRIHIPIQTNPQVVFRVNQQTIPIQAGECWYANFNLPHYVSNDGDTDRIHLVIDGIRNEWTDQLFKDMGYDFEFENISKEPDRQTKYRMIEELATIKTEASEQLIAKLTMELGIS